jgi:hypothetical protein
MMIVFRRPLWRRRCPVSLQGVVPASPALKEPHTCGHQVRSSPCRLRARVAAGSAGAAGRTIVHADGRIGSFRIGVTSEAQIRSRLGRPAKVEGPNAGSLLGRLLEYRCGSHCWTRYGISAATGKLSDFVTGSSGFMTEHGSYIGMSAALVARREGSKPVPGCGSGLYIHVRWDARYTYVLTVSQGSVDGIVVLGPHSVYYDGLC